MPTMPASKLQQLLNNSVDRKKVHGIQLAVSTPDGDWFGASGNLQPNQQIFIASTTKIYVSAIIFQLESEGKLSLNDKLSKYLEPTQIEGLHEFKGASYGASITIEQLLAHTSGLADYFQQKTSSGSSLLEQLKNGNDQSWSFNDVLEMNRRMKPHFQPGTPGKALYSDTNYQILGFIIEKITGQTLATVFQQRIFAPLGLSHSYLYQNPTDSKPAPFYRNHTVLNIPQAMSSFGADGGIVSNASEMLVFLKAWFNGHFFPTSRLPELSHWNRIFFPLQYGVGLMRFKLPWLLNPFSPVPEMLGHSGLSGAFAFYCPEWKIYLSGTVNQLESPDISYRLMIKTLLLLRKNAQ